MFVSIVIYLFDLLCIFAPINGALRLSNFFEAGVKMTTLFRVWNVVETHLMSKKRLVIKAVMLFFISNNFIRNWNSQNIKQKLSKMLWPNFRYWKIIHFFHSRYYPKVKGHILKYLQINKCVCFSGTTVFKNIHTSRYLIWSDLLAFTGFLSKYFLKHCWKTLEEADIFNKLQASSAEVFFFY